MRKFALLILAVCVVSCSQQYRSLDEVLSSLDAESIDSIKADTFVFKEAYKILLNQPVDHNNPEGEKFSQKIYLSFAGIDKPVVVVTEGYEANRNYTTELASLLECNQIIIEHRYFGESVPEIINWDNLNTEQAASDHHKVIEIFKQVFRGEWITTGISKGGQTVLFHSYYYPDDADIRIPYVAPLNFGPEDSRIYTFMPTTGLTIGRNRKISLCS